MSSNPSRRRRWLIAAVVVVLLYAIVGFLVLPPVVRGQIETRAGAALKRPVTVEKVRMNPFAFSVAIEGLRVTDHDGVDLASWKRGYANFDPLTSLFRREWHVGALELIEPRQRLVLDSEGRLNIEDLLVRPSVGEAPPEETDATGRMPAVAVGRLVVESWAVSFDDASRGRPFATVIGPMTFELDGLTTRPDADSPYRLRGTTDTGETFGWSGTVSVTPPGSEGSIEFSGVSLPKHSPLVDDLHRAEVVGGTVSFSTRYVVSFGDRPVIQIMDTRVTVDDLALGFAGADVEEAVVSFAQLDVHIAQADALARTAEVASVTLEGLDVKAERRTDGSIDLLDWIPASTASETADESASGASDPGPAPSVSVTRIELVGGRVQLTDRTNPRPAEFVLDELAITATGAGTDLAREIGVEIGLRWAGAGTVGMRGTVRPRPFAAGLDVNVTDFALRPLDPFVEPTADVRIRDGAVTVKGRVEAEQPPGEALALRWTGDVDIRNLDTADGKLDSTLVAWKSLALKQTAVALAPLEVSAGEVALDGLLANVAIAEDGTINLLAALRRDEANEGSSEVEPSAPSVASGEADEPAYRAKVDLVSITGGVLRVQDQSVAGGFKTELREFGGTIRGLSSENLARADVDLGARLDGVAPLRIAGSINPLAEDKYSDVTVDFGNIDLPLFSPYSGRFIGQRIQRGKLSVNLGYKVSQNTLAGENRVVMDQFYLGEKVESPDALKLPVGLALALLRDREGKITLDVPVSGRLDDPEFKYGRVVWQTLGNIFVRAVASPFKLLGGLLPAGARDVDLSFIDFASAEVEPREDESKKIELLGKALFERPALRLEIKAPTQLAGDEPGLIARRMEEGLQAEKARLAEVATMASTTAAVTEEREALLRSWFAREFPDEAARAFAVEPAITRAAPVEETTTVAQPAEPGRVSRFFRGLFGGGEKPDATSPESTVAEATAVQASEGEDGSVLTEPPLALAEIEARLVATLVVSEADAAELAAARARVVRDLLLAGGKVQPERVFLVDAPAIPDGAETPPTGVRVFFGLQ
ncbi:DUF748 domain-containing protein [Opitutales bacterium ASA1]|uniref:DUF748 domain-containing protein n=1 Tax=Congregicoccus parvus TaxID=3081749 RepID=UPI002B313479|nr:DUF748 domain-containing protein [Opitutales bacterium ASA1]